MRICLEPESRASLFAALTSRGTSLEVMATSLGVSVRTVSDWKRGKYTIPAQQFELLLSLSGLSRESMRFSTVSPWWHTRQAGKKGSLARSRAHGPLGTPQSRRLGGMNSYVKRQQNPDDIFARKKIILPGHNEEFAEFMGIMLGDGNITKYQVSISLSSLVDAEYGFFVAKLIEDLFGLRPKLSTKNGSNCILITVSSIALVELLTQEGLVLGNKLRQGLDMPAWVRQNNGYARACLRGLFDTDGSVYEEVHRVAGRQYSYPRWSLVSASSNLRESISLTLTDLEFTPKIRNNRGGKP